MTLETEGLTEVEVAANNGKMVSRFRLILKIVLLGIFYGIEKACRSVLSRSLHLSQNHIHFWTFEIFNRKIGQTLSICF